MASVSDAASNRYRGNEYVQDQIWADAIGRGGKRKGEDKQEGNVKNEEWGKILETGTTKVEYVKYVQKGKNKDKKGVAEFIAVPFLGGGGCRTKI